MSENNLKEMMQQIPLRMVAVSVSVHGNGSGSVWMGPDRETDLVPESHLKAILAVAPLSTATSYYSCVYEKENAVDSLRFVAKKIRENASK